jgi:hypothetical protein
LAAISIGQREFEQWNLDVSALRCVPSGSKSRHFKRQASQEFWLADHPPIGHDANPLDVEPGLEPIHHGN